jgi:cell division protein FtsB
MRQSTALRQKAARTAVKTPQRRSRHARRARAQRAPGGRGPGTAHTHNPWKRRAFFLGLAAILLCAFFLPLQIKSWELQSELNQLQNKKQELLLQQQQAQQQLGYYSSDAYVEEAARQDLGLVKPGEDLVMSAAPGATKPLPKNNHNGITGPYGD